MQQPSQRIRELLIKYRKNRCSKEEYEELIQLAQMSGNDLVIKEIMWKDWGGQELDVSIKRQMMPRAYRKTWKTNLKIAASIAILVAVGLVFFQWLSPDPVAYATGNGEVMEITLPDGSEVILNANSQLTWIPTDNKNDDRLVELTGEAFFKVAKEVISVNDQNEKRGFQVLTPKMTVHVLGTSFNVAARDENTEVFLEEGVVELMLPDHADEYRKMTPGDKFILDNHTGLLIEKKSEDLLTSASWVTGVLNYHDRSMEEVLRSISELFGVEIYCEDSELKTKKINLGVPYMDWENTRRALEIAIEVNFKEEGGIYTVVPTDENKY